jgi:hypothetical protein
LPPAADTFLEVTSDELGRTLPTALRGRWLAGAFEDRVEMSGRIELPLPAGSGRSEFGEEDGDRVDFLAGAAGGTPDAEDTATVGRFFGGELGDDLAFEKLEVGGLPEEERVLVEMTSMRLLSSSSPSGRA